MSRRALLVFLGLLLVMTLAPGSASAADPPKPTTPGGLPAGRHLSAVDRPGQAQAAAAGNCSASDVNCKPDDLSGSCTTNVRQDIPPATIRVLTGTTVASIKTVDFKAYVEDSLYNEWVPTWDGDAVKAGAIAVKSFAWYWATHYGGYVGSSSSPDNCFDVSTDTNFFQAYVAGTGSKDSKTIKRVTDTWPVAVRSNGQVVETHYQKSLSSPSEPCGYDAGGTVDSYMSQYGTQACNEVNGANNGYRYNVILRLYYGKDIDLSTTAQLRTPHDFNFTARSTAAAFAAGRWTIADGYPTTFAFGQKGDLPFASTNGDGFATAGVWRPSNRTFYVANALHQLVSTVRFGNAGDVPVAAHYRGLDTATQPAVFRPSTGTWYFAGPGGAIASTSRYGLNGDIPVPGRWTSSTSDVISVWRPSNGTWNVPGQKAPVSWGLRGDVPAPADYTGDGITDVAVYRPSTHAFYVRNAPRVVWGVSGDVPVTGDFDGDGKADFAVYRPSNGNVYVHNQASVVNVGKGAVPIGAAPFRG